MYAYFGHEVKAAAPKGGQNAENIQPNTQAASNDPDIKKDIVSGDSKPNAESSA